MYRAVKILEQAEAVAGKAIMDARQKQEMARYAQSQLAQLRGEQAPSETPSESKVDEESRARQQQLQEELAKKEEELRLARVRYVRGE